MNSIELIDAVRDRFSEAVSASHTFRDDTTLVLKGEFLVEVEAVAAKD